MAYEKVQQLRKAALRLRATAIGKANNICKDCEDLPTCPHLLHYAKYMRNKTLLLFPPCSNFWHRRAD